MAALFVERSIWISAPRERVWQAVSDPKQIEQWFLPPALGMQLKRDEADKLFVLMGPMEVEIARFENVESPRRITTRSLPDGVIATTYTLEEEQNGTRVTVRMSGFEALPPDAAQERLAPSGTGWEKALQNLKAFIGGEALPFPEGFITTLFGYRRETPQKLSVERSIWINAPRERVWQAITDPAQIQQWFSPNTPWRGTGLEVGGRVSPYDPETGNDLTVEVYELVDAPRLLVTRTHTAPPDTGNVTEWALAEENGGTRLTLTHSGYEQKPVETRHNDMEQNGFGFGMVLQNLKAQLEGTSLPYPFGF
ncbi:MAG: SRPBCC family protein [Chloroflexota bacterium]